MMLYGGWMLDIARAFQRRFDAIVVNYNFEHGAEFEIALAELLREILPLRAGVCRGYVVDRAGTVAGDDIIIYDQVRFPAMRLLDRSLALKQRVPVEAVLAYIEAKHTLRCDGEGGQSLRKACDQVRAVKRLSREKVDRSQITNTLRMEGVPFGTVGGGGFSAHQNPMYAAVWGRNALPNDGFDALLAEGIRDLASERPFAELPDVVAAGAVVALPFYRDAQVQGEVRPFLGPTGTHPVLTPAPDASFGLAVIHLLWAIDRLALLGPMPWGEMLMEHIRPNASELWVVSETRSPHGS